MSPAIDKEEVSETSESSRSADIHRVTTSFTLDIDDSRWVANAAAANQVSRSAIVRQAVRHFKNSRNIGKV